MADTLFFNLSEIQQVGQKLWASYKNNTTWCFVGDMGAGKTTLIASIVQAAGSTDHVTSPTFGLVNTYYTLAGHIFHFDCYRLQSIREAIDIGFETYFSDSNWCFIEWPEKVSVLLPEKILIFGLKVVNEDTRELQILTHEQFEGNW